MQASSAVLSRYEVMTQEKMPLRSCRMHFPPANHHEQHLVPNTPDKKVGVFATGILLASSSKQEVTIEGNIYQGIDSLIIVEGGGATGMVYFFFIG